MHFYLSLTSLYTLDRIVCWNIKYRDGKMKHKMHVNVGIVFSGHNIWQLVKMT